MNWPMLLSMQRRSSSHSMLHPYDAIHSAPPPQKTSRHAALQRRKCNTNAVKSPMKPDATFHAGV